MNFVCEKFREAALSADSRDFLRDYDVEILLGMVQAERFPAELLQQVFLSSQTIQNSLFSSPIEQATVLAEMVHRIDSHQRFYGGEYASEEEIKLFLEEYLERKQRLANQLYSLRPDSAASTVVIDTTGYSLKRTEELCHALRRCTMHGRIKSITLIPSADPRAVLYSLPSGLIELNIQRSAARCYDRFLARYVGELLQAPHALSQLKALSMTDCRLSSSAIMDYLCAGWSEHASLMSLDLSNNILDEDGAQALGQVVRNSASLQRLVLSNNLLGQGNGLGELCIELMQCDQPVLRELHLAGNQIALNGAFALSVWLSSTKARELRRLDLTNNNICGEGMRLLATSLLSNTSELHLTRLDLEDNLDDGAEVRRALQVLRLGQNLLAIRAAAHQIQRNSTVAAKERGRRRKQSALSRLPQELARLVLAMLRAEASG